MALMADYEMAGTFAQHLHKREQAQQLLIQSLIQQPVGETHREQLAGLADAYIKAQRYIDHVVYVEGRKYGPVVGAPRREHEDAGGRA
jgi:hypothetical protein